MLAATLDDPRVVADLVYAKTEQGRAELVRRGAGLGARQRSVLIMIDGHKRCAALAALVPAPQLGAILGELETLGLICALAPAPVLSAPPLPPMAQGPRSTTTAAPRPESAATRAPATARVPATARAAIDPGLLANAKRTMIASAETYLGLLAAEVVRQVDAAGDEDQLLRALGHWHMAMQASKHGREVAVTYLEQIKAGLRGASATAPLTPA